MARENWNKPDSNSNNKALQSCLIKKLVLLNVRLQKARISCFPVFSPAFWKAMSNCSEVLLNNPGGPSVKKSGKGWSQSWTFYMQIQWKAQGLGSRPSLCDKCLYRRESFPFIRHLSRVDTSLALLLRVKVTFRSSKLLCSLDRWGHSQVRAKSFTFNRVKLT